MSIPIGSALAAGSINLSALTASGTASSSTYLRGDGSWATPSGSGSGTVTSVSVTSANGVSGSVANSTTTPAITLTLGAITPSSIGVGTAASGTTGEIRATNNVTAYYASDARLKENVKNIENPVEKVMQLNGVAYDWSENYVKAHGGEDGFFVRKHDIGLIAQEVQAVLPEIVVSREDGYLALKYDRVVALLVEVVKNQEVRIKELESKLMTPDRTV